MGSPVLTSVPGGGRHVVRGRKVIANGIEKRLYAFILIGGTAKHGTKIAGDGGFADAATISFR